MDSVDLYTKNGERTGETVSVDSPRKPGTYIKIVHVWIRNARGELLLTKRAPDKTFGGLWECPGGGAIAGETSLDTALREVQEETGLTLTPENGRHIHRCVYEAIYAVCDVWLFDAEYDPDDMILQKNEVTDRCFALPDKVLSLCASGAFVPVYGYLDWLMGCIGTLY